MSKDPARRRSCSPKILLAEDLYSARSTRPKQDILGQKRKYNPIKIRLIKRRSTQIRNLKITLQVRKYPYFLSSVRSLNQERTQSFQKDKHQTGKRVLISLLYQNPKKTLINESTAYTTGTRATLDQTL